jgi:hypothetical protein
VCYHMKPLAVLAGFGQWLRAGIARADPLPSEVAMPARSRDKTMRTRTRKCLIEFWQDADQRWRFAARH